MTAYYESIFIEVDINATVLHCFIMPLVSGNIAENNAVKIMLSTVLKLYR